MCVCVCVKCHINDDWLKSQSYNNNFTSRAKVIYNIYDIMLNTQSQE